MDAAFAPPTSITTAAGSFSKESQWSAAAHIEECSARSASVDSLCLRGVKSNRDAIGAAITVETTAGRQIRFVQAGSGFLSQHSKDVFFGLGDTQGAVTASSDGRAGWCKNWTGCR